MLPTGCPGTQLVPSQTIVSPTDAPSSTSEISVSFVMAGRASAVATSVTSCVFSAGVMPVPSMPGRAMVIRTISCGVALIYLLLHSVRSAVAMLRAAAGTSTVRPRRPACRVDLVSRPRMVVAIEIEADKRGMLQDRASADVPPGPAVARTVVIDFGPGDLHNRASDARDAAAPVVVIATVPQDQDGIVVRADTLVGVVATDALHQLHDRGVADRRGPVEAVVVRPLSDTPHRPQ